MVPDFRGGWGRKTTSARARWAPWLYIHTNVVDYVELDLVLEGRPVRISCASKIESISYYCQLQNATFFEFMSKP